MIDLTKLPGFKRQRPSTVLALSLDGSQLDGVVLRRTNGSVQLLQTVSATLSLDPLTADPELVGREIRNHLDVAGVRERNCLVCVPLKWAMTTHTEIPEAAEADVPGFLQLEAERGFHSDAESLHFGTSRYAIDGRHYAALVGIPKNNVVVLEKVLRAAKLKPLSFSLGMTALQSPAAEKSNNVLALLISESNVALQITSGGGVVALRALEGTVEMQGGRRVLHADVVVREARITLGQLPAELRDKVRTVRIYGPRDLATQLADEIELKLEQMALKVEIVKNYAPDEFGVQFPADAGVSPAFSFAAQYLADQATLVEFLPPHIPTWQQYAEKYGSGKARKGILLGAAVVVILVGMFLYQEVQLVHWQSQWNKMSADVTELKAIEAKIQQYRPWSDDEIRGLSILKLMSQAFPEDGSVTAKTLEIRDLSTVICSGTARSMQALVNTQGALEKKPGISGVKITRFIGHAPSIQFTLDIQCNGGSLHAN
ncbi:MAG TPA: hypothetical protein VN761_09840 [Candidatus Polarisedimenticolia bacterium]|nr:hypothetical protein [Candidatus Polarisedimenticolia bacterium]